MNDETLADAIRRLRGDMTQEQFAARVGISASMIGHVEAGRRSLGLPSLERIEQALGLNDLERSRLRSARNRASQRSRSSRVELIGPALRDARKARGFTQADLASRLGVTGFALAAILAMILGQLIHSAK